MKNNKFPLFQNNPDLQNIDNWDEWLTKTEAQLKKLGYYKYTEVGNHEEDFTYWKTLYTKSKKKVHLGVFFFDFRNTQFPRIGVQFRVYINSVHLDDVANCRLEINEDMPLKKVEKLAKKFYKFVEYAK